MPPKIRAPKSESHTTLVGLAYEDHGFAGADSRVAFTPCGRVWSNTFDKVIPLFQGFYLLSSGSCYVNEELREVLPICLDERRATTMEEVLDRCVAWVNFFCEYFRCTAPCFVIGGFENQGFRIGKIDRDVNYAGYVHTSWLLEKNSVVIMGSGEYFANQIIRGTEMKKLIRGGNISERSAIKIVRKILSALKSASRADWCTGGTLNVVHLEKNAATSHSQEPINPILSSGKYKQIIKRVLYNSKNEEGNEQGGQKKGGQKKRKRG